jgi:6,7-dimethyl-8-ribityllumazine synthase
MPLMAQELANSGKYHAIIIAAFVVDGGIYRHDFVAQSVVDGLMRVSLDTGTPVLFISLSPYQYQNTPEHNEFSASILLAKAVKLAKLRFP